MTGLTLTLDPTAAAAPRFGFEGFAQPAKTLLGAGLGLWNATAAFIPFVAAGPAVMALPASSGESRPAARLFGPPVLHAANPGAIAAAPEALAAAWRGTRHALRPPAAWLKSAAWAAASAPGRQSAESAAAVSTRHARQELRFVRPSVATAPSTGLRVASASENSEQNLSMMIPAPDRTAVPSDLPNGPGIASSPSTTGLPGHATAAHADVTIPLTPGFAARSAASREDAAQSASELAAAFLPSETVARNPVEEAPVSAAPAQRAATASPTRTETAALNRTDFIGIKNTPMGDFPGTSVSGAPRAEAESDSAANLAADPIASDRPSVALVGPRFESASASDEADFAAIRDTFAPGLLGVFLIPSEPTGFVDLRALQNPRENAHDAAFRSEDKVQALSASSSDSEDSGESRDEEARQEG